jgi:hypothetical protein
LTKKTNNGYGISGELVKQKQPAVDIAIDSFDIVINRLAELEDKIERGELVDVKENHLIAISRTSGKSSKQLDAVDILAKYENGTLIELPCKVGDMVWEIIQSPNGNFISKEIIGDYWITEDGIVARTGFYSTDSIEIEEFGKTVFLTKAEAEQKLKELEK